MVGAAPRLRNDVVDRSSDTHAPCLQTGLTEATVAAQNTLAELYPCASVAPHMPIATHRVGLPLHRLVGVLLAVRFAVRDECAAPSVLARFQRALCHFPVVYSCVVCIITHMNSTELIKRIKADGWYHVHTVGSHHQFKHPTKPGKVTVPHPKKDLLIATVRSVLKQAGLK